ncbi:MAG: hypothetical protein LBK95_17095 [Bifidobacteriaceae bacterium]|nr:hypothetical protein [Bifidobacteriaceae bacterium]
MTTAPDHNWDEALADLLATETELGGASGPAPGVEPPHGWSQPEAQAAPEAAVLALGIGDKWLLAALLKGPQIAARALASEGLGLAVLDDPAEESATKAAETASGTLRGQHILLLRRGESADPAAGDIQAYLYLDGQSRQRVSPGLVLAQSPQLLEDLLIDPDSAARALAGAVDVSKISAADAIAIIGRSVSASRRAKRGWRQRRSFSGAQPEAGAGDEAGGSDRPGDGGSGRPGAGA